MRKCYAGLDSSGREAIESRICRYLSSWSEGLSTARMAAWIDSCTKNGGYTFGEYQQCLKSLRHSGRVAIANGIWYLRGPVKESTSE